MSLDLSLVCETCGTYVGDFNYTYNVSGMWGAVVPEDAKMIEIEGWTGQQSVPKLEAALEKLRADPAKFEAMNPSNGWGSYERFCEFIGGLIKCAKKHPEAKWRAFR